MEIMDEKLKHVHLIEELRHTFEDVENQLIKDADKWKDTWKERGLVWENMNQETRFFFKMQDYLADFNEGIPVNWAKVIGEAHICLVREKKLK